MEGLWNSATSSVSYDPGKCGIHFQRGLNCPCPPWKIPFGSVLIPFQTRWAGACQLLQHGQDTGPRSVLEHFYSWQEAVKNKGTVGRGNVSPNWLAPWITEMPACQRVNHWSCLWCLLRSRTHQPAANVVFPLMCFLSFCLSFTLVHVHVEIFFFPLDACSCHTLCFDSFSNYQLSRVG